MKKALLLFLTVASITSVVALTEHINDKLILLYHVKTDIEKSLKDTQQYYLSIMKIMHENGTINEFLFFEQIYTAFSKDPYMLSLINLACDEIIDHRYSDIDISKDTASYFNDLVVNENKYLILAIMHNFKHIFDEYHQAYCKNNKQGALVNMTIQDCFFMTPNCTKIQLAIGLIVYCRTLLPLVLEKIEAKIKKLETPNIR